MWEWEVKFESSTDMMSDDSWFEFDEFKYSEITEKYNQRLDYIFDLLSVQKESENYKVAEKLKSNFQYIKTLINNLRNYNKIIEGLQKRNLDEEIEKDISDNQWKALKLLKETVIQINIFESSLLELEIFLRIVAKPGMESTNTKSKKSNWAAEITQMIDKMKKERLKNTEKARLDIEDEKQRVNYETYIDNNWTEIIWEEKKPILSDWLVEKANKTRDLSENVIKMYIAAAIINPEFYLKDIITLLNKNIIEGKKWDINFLNFLNSLSRNNEEMIKVVTPLKKSYLENCTLDLIWEINSWESWSRFDNKLYDITKSLNNLWMIKESILIEEQLQKRWEYIKLQDIQIQRLFWDISFKKSIWPISVFTIYEDNISLWWENTNEDSSWNKSSYIIVFATPELKEIFMNTPEWRIEADKKAKELKDIIEPERKEEEILAKLKQIEQETKRFEEIKRKLPEIDKRNNLEMSQESIKTEKELEEQGEYFKLQDTQIERLFWRIHSRKFIWPASIFRIKEDNIYFWWENNWKDKSKEKSSYIIVFINAKTKDIFLNTPEWMREADEKVNEFRNTIEPKREAIKVANEKKTHEIEERTKTEEIVRKENELKNKKRGEKDKFEKSRKLFNQK